MPPRNTTTAVRIISLSGTNDHEGSRSIPTTVEPVDTHHTLLLPVQCVFLEHHRYCAVKHNNNERASELAFVGNHLFFHGDTKIKLSGAEAHGATAIIVLIVAVLLPPRNTPQRVRRSRYL